MARSPKSDAIKEKIEAESVAKPRTGSTPAGETGARALSKQDLAGTVAEKMDMSRAKAVEAVDAMLGAIGDALKEKHEVRLTGFGTFTTAERKASTGRNPRTGEEIQIAASTSVKFKPGKALKDSVAG